MMKPYVLATCPLLLSLLGACKADDVEFRKGEGGASAAGTAGSTHATAGEAGQSTGGTAGAAGTQTTGGEAGRSTGGTAGTGGSECPFEVVHPAGELSLSSRHLSLQDYCETHTCPDREDVLSFVEPFCSYTHVWLVRGCGYEHVAVRDVSGTRGDGYVYEEDTGTLVGAYSVGDVIIDCNAVGSYGGLVPEPCFEIYGNGFPVEDGAGGGSITVEDVCTATPGECFSPTQNLHLAYDGDMPGCPCEDVGDPCVEGVALVCENGTWTAVEDGPCMPMDRECDGRVDMVTDCISLFDICYQLSNRTFCGMYPRTGLCAGGQLVSTQSDCLVDDAYCAPAGDGLWCTGPGDRTCPEGREPMDAADCLTGDYSCEFHSEGLACRLPLYSVQECEDAGGTVFSDPGDGSLMAAGCPEGRQALAFIDGFIEGGLCCEE